MTFRASAPLTAEWEHFDLAIERGVATLQTFRIASLGRSYDDDWW